jgi:hypothetical protein
VLLQRPLLVVMGWVVSRSRKVMGAGLADGGNAVCCTLSCRVLLHVLLLLLLREAC